MSPRTPTSRSSVTALDTAGYVQLNERPFGGHARLLEMVGTDKRVLDVGCSSGYLARPLVERGCIVVGIERDPDAARIAQHVCEEVSSAMSKNWSCRSNTASFDVVLCGDLVEHLRDPQTFLVRMRPYLRERRSARAQHAQRRELGDPSRPPRRPLAVHRPRDARPNARPPLHAHDAVEALRSAGYR